MLTDEEKRYIRHHAYIPEHLVDLMTGVSGGEPFLIDDWFCCLRDDWLIVVGYPLGHDFRKNEFETLTDKAITTFRPGVASLMAPELPETFLARSREREADYYYTVKVGEIKIGSGLRRVLRKARKHLVVERSTEMLEDHNQLIDEFIQRVEPYYRVKNLLRRMPDYLHTAPSSVVLNAWDGNDHLTAFYVVDSDARDFNTYVIGGHSKKHYVPGASDLLCHEMMLMSEEQGKPYVHLGLGVNDGIRRFKRKWGGIPALRYEMCEMTLRKPSLRETFTAMLKRV